MKYSDGIEETKANRVCFQCVGEEYLATKVRTEGAQGKCDYCGDLSASFSIAEMAKLIKEAFASHYVRTSDQPNNMEYSMLRDRESDYEWNRDGEQVVYAIMNAADIPEPAARDIQSVLEDEYSDFEADKIGEETEFSSGSHYTQRGPDPSQWMIEWRTFDESLRSEARFFSKSAEKHLASIFDQFESLETADGQPIILNAGPNTNLRELFRARVFQDDRSLEAALERPDRHLGPPPSRLANAGRMNARGISVFYGANSAAIALAEVRPPVGSRVAVARFEIIRPVRLLDLTALDGVITRGSIFDAGYAGQLERSAFLRTLSQRLARPVMPDDEAFAYLATQAVADYLSTDSEKRLDGIIYPSVQAGGSACNVVLFYKSARVKALAIPKGTEISASLFSDDEDEMLKYFVIERAPREQPEQNELNNLFSTFALSPILNFEQKDSREQTLQIDANTLYVHHINAVEIKSSAFSVMRHRWEKHDDAF